MEMVVDMNNLILFLRKIAECHGCCYLMTVLFNSFAVCGNVHRVTRLENKTCLFFLSQTALWTNYKFSTYWQSYQALHDQHLFEKVSWNSSLKRENDLRIIAISSDYSLMIKKPGGCLVSQPVQFVLDSFRHIWQFLFLVANRFLSFTKCFIYHSKWRLKFTC